MKNVLLGLVLAVSFAAVRADACSCVGPGTPTHELGRATAVFAGKVVNIVRDPSGFGLIVTFHVDRQWKGVHDHMVTVKTGPHSAACGFGFRAHHEYLVYAHDYQGHLHTSLCTRTKALAQATEDLRELGPGHKPH
jgi:hypothetical protein